MLIGHGPSGVAIIRPTAMSDACRHDLRNAVHKLLPECPAAILIDLSEVSDVSALVQMTLLSLAVEAGREPGTPLAFCTADPKVARALAQSGRTMRVFSSIAEAGRALVSTPGTSWIHRPLGSGSGAPSAAAGHVAEACLMWQLPQIQEPARTVAFHLVWMARGAHELHLTLSLRSRRQLLINVRNYSTAAKSASESRNRMALSAADEARILAKGATACGRLLTGAGVAWWAMLSSRTSG